jgi:hypothetical protein
MPVEVVTGGPAHPIPEQVKEKLHRELDAALDIYAWSQKSVLQRFSWDYGESAGRVCIYVDPHG